MSREQQDPTRWKINASLQTGTRASQLNWSVRKWSSMEDSIKGKYLNLPPVTSVEFFTFTCICYLLFSL